MTNSSQARGRRRRTPYAWLGAGVLGVGMWSALAGAGVAAADDQADSNAGRNAAASATSRTGYVASRTGYVGGSAGTASAKTAPARASRGAAVRPTLGSYKPHNGFGLIPSATSPVSTPEPVTPGPGLVVPSVNPVASADGRTDSRANDSNAASATRTSSAYKVKTGTIHPGLRSRDARSALGNKTRVKPNAGENTEVGGLYPGENTILLVNLSGYALQVDSYDLPDGGGLRYSPAVGAVTQPNLTMQFNFWSASSASVTLSGVTASSQVWMIQGPGPSLPASVTLQASPTPGITCSGGSGSICGQYSSGIFSKHVNAAFWVYSYDTIFMEPEAA